MLFYCTAPAGKRRIFSLPSNHSANEKLLQLSQWKATTPSFLYQTLCLQQPLWAPPFLYKIKFLSFVPWTLPDFTIRLHVPNCNSLLVPNKPILLEKYLAICLKSAIWSLILHKWYYFATFRALKCFYNPHMLLCEHLFYDFKRHEASHVCTHHILPIQFSTNRLPNCLQLPIEENQNMSPPKCLTDIKITLT